jgi:hypothetical protein
MIGRVGCRLFDSAAASLGRDDLMRLGPADFLASRVFRDPAG